MSFFLKTTFLLIIFFFPITASAQVVINEIAWAGSFESSADEWIELYNAGSEEVDLEGWKLLSRDGSPEIFLSGAIGPKEFFLMERTDDESSPARADFFYTGALGNAGEYLEFFNSVDVLVDFVDESEGWKFGDNESKQTMERALDLSWQTSVDAGGTPGTVNLGGDNTSSNSPLNEGGEINGESSLNEGGETDVSAREIFRPGDLVINEFVSDPVSGEEEWIEIFNNSSKTVNLNDWKIKEGGGSLSNLAGFIEPRGFFVLENPKGNLNNSGDEIILLSPADEIIDKTFYGDWGDDLFGQNAPAPKDPASLARCSDGVGDFNSKKYFCLTQIPTKGASNEIVFEIDSDKPADKFLEKFKSSQDLIITEIFPNPLGDDREGEFIEIFNRGEKTVNLDGWMIQDKFGSQYVFSSDFEIGPKKYFVLTRRQSGIILDNTDDEVKLFPPLSESACQTLEYSQAPPHKSYARIKNMIGDWEWIWADKPTKGFANFEEEKNYEPVVEIFSPETIKVGQEIIFDASDSLDPDGDELSFFWDFGDGVNLNLASPAHTYLEPGEYDLLLRISDGENFSFKDKKIKVVSSSNSDFSSDIEKTVEPFLGREVIINEIFPSPVGSDAEGEFLEIKNIGENKVNLLGWVVDDEEGGSRPFEFSQNVYLAPNEIFVLDREESGIALNNSADKVRLFDDSGDLLDEVDYFSAPEGKSYSLGLNNKWFWTDKPSPGQKNEIDFSFDWDIGLEGSVISGVNNFFEENFLTCEDVWEIPEGEIVEVAGVVGNLPGSLAEQYFYLLGSPGVQVYNYHKDFPVLAVGDYVQVMGEVSEARGIRRIKTETAEDIKIMETGVDIIPASLGCAEVGDEYIGAFLEIEGVITDKKSGRFFIDDGLGEIEAILKDGIKINEAEFKENDKVKVKGILAKSGDDLKIFPTGEGDIEVLEQDKEEVDVLGETMSVSEWNLDEPKKDKNNFLEKLALPATAIFSFGVGFFLNKKF